MPILSSELLWYKAAEMSDAVSNGGRMSATLAPTGVKNNIWPNVSESERSSGSTKYRKVFIKVANDDDLVLFSSRVFVENFTPSEDAVTIFTGTQTDVQDDITGSERLYGCGQLNVAASAGATSIQVLTEDAGLDYLQDGDIIRISDKPEIGGAGNTEFKTIDGAVTYSGDVATVPLDSALSNTYSETDTRVSSTIDTGDLSTDVTSVVTTSGGGDYDDTTYPVVGDNLGTVEQTWTLTFTSATAFDIVGNTLGNVGSGNVSSGASPNNADFSAPYFTLDSAGFSGSFTAGDTLVFSSSPAAVPIWYRRDVPAGANSYSGTSVKVGISGESG